MRSAQMVILCVAAASLMAGCGGGYSGPPRVLDPQATATPTASPASTSSPTAAATSTPVALPTVPASATASPSAAASSLATAFPSASASASATATSSPTPVSSATASGTSTAVASPVASPTASSVAAIVGCPPNPVPSPASTTVAFPTGSGGSASLPAYADVSGSFVFPANSATAGTTITTKIGESNYDSFPLGSQGGTGLIYLEASTSAVTGVTFTGSAPYQLVVTSASCFSTAHTYYVDVDSSGVTLVSGTGTASNNGQTETFSLATSSFRSGTLQFEIKQS